MRRREFIALIGGAAAAAGPLCARAQQPTKRLIGFLRNTSAADSARLLNQFRRGLKETGYVEDQNVAVEYRWADNRLDRLPALAADLVQRRVEVIVSGGNAASLAAKAATKKIPIVFSVGDDPIELGLVANLNRPADNITGVTFFGGEILEAKRLELLHQLVPQAVTIAYLTHPESPSTLRQLHAVQAAADRLGQKILVLEVHKEGDLDTVFATIVEKHVGALLVAADSLFFSLRNQLVTLAARHRIPTAYRWHQAVATGGLMGYGASITDAYHQAGIYAGRILKGEKPADLPIVQSTKFELAINLKTAKALGLAVPQNLLIAADDVIE
jgi:ABC-type uncharacterized transport system substrate-binding protein